MAKLEDLVKERHQKRQDKKEKIRQGHKFKKRKRIRKGRKIKILGIHSYHIGYNPDYQQYVKRLTQD